MLVVVAMVVMATVVVVVVVAVVVVVVVVAMVTVVAVVAVCMVAVCMVPGRVAAHNQALGVRGQLAKAGPGRRQSRRLDVATGRKPLLLPLFPAA